MDERRQLCDPLALENIRVLLREALELNELRARVRQAEARSRAKHTASRALDRGFCHHRSTLNPRQPSDALPWAGVDGRPQHRGCTRR
jgi:hypothetical protein